LLVIGYPLVPVLYGVVSQEVPSAGYIQTSAAFKVDKLMSLIVLKELS
jgi:hypothetical protein